MNEISAIDTNVKDAMHIGVNFQLHGDGDWGSVKEEAIRYIKERAGKGKYDYVLICEMPCGNTLKFRSHKEIRQLPIEDVPCSCGNPNHWFIKYSRW